MKKRRGPSYSEKLKAIQPYVDFKLKNPNRASKKTRTEISRYFNAVKQLKGQNRAFVKIKSEKNRSRAIRQLTPDKAKLSRFKGAFVPGNYGDRPKLEFPKDEKSIRIRTAYSEEDISYFDMERFAKDPEKELRRAYRRLKGYSTIVPLSVTGSDDETLLNTSGAGDLESLIEEVLALISKYPSATEYTNKQGETRPGWLRGLKGVDFENQEEPDEEEEQDESEEEIRVRPRRTASKPSRHRKGKAAPRRPRKTAPKKGNPRRGARPRPNHAPRRGTKRAPLRSVRKAKVIRKRAPLRKKRR